MPSLKCDIARHIHHHHNGSDQVGQDESTKVGDVIHRGFILDNSPTVVLAYGLVEVGCYYYQDGYQKGRQVGYQ